MDRRTALRHAAAIVAGLALPGCAPGRAVRAHPFPPARARLARVHVSEHRLIRTVAGLRPYRPSGFRVGPERMGETLVIHNYGHGGAGVTLSWGSAWLALEHALAQPHRRAAVLGCGAVGLATARLLQDHGFTVTLYARDLPPNTTSNVAGALWSPVGVADWDQREGPFAPVLARAARIAHRRFQTLVGERYGVRWLPLYMLNPRVGAGVPWTWRLTPELYNAERLEPREHPFPQPGAWHAHTMMIEPDPYLRALLEDFRLAGGEVVVRDFPDLAAVLALPEPVVLNCTGLGARALFGDRELKPVKGQLAFLVPQPEVEHMYIAGDLYMFPRRDGILLGGTYEAADSVEPDPAATARILEGHRRLALQMR
ncbi:MAG TPA: FAD-dependent oxidoreductase [Longimicrobiaceae bacterium]|nr:FAD-dependent oxidoreductase [Longimicrobiaceae bacterium]